MSTSRIVANQSKLTRAIALANMRIRLYVREAPHESPFGTTTELAKALSSGFVNKDGLPIPARPFMKQFFAENKNEITQHLVDSGVWKMKGPQAKSALDANAQWLLSAFRMWLVTGGVTPPNALDTIIRKKNNIPLYEHGTLLAAIDVEAKIASVK